MSRMDSSRIFSSSAASTPPLAPLARLALAARITPCTRTATVPRLEVHLHVHLPRRRRGAQRGMRRQRSLHGRLQQLQRVAQARLRDGALLLILVVAQVPVQRRIRQFIGHANAPRRGLDEQEERAHVCAGICCGRLHGSAPNSTAPSGDAVYGGVHAVVLGHALLVALQQLREARGREGARDSQAPCSCHVMGAHLVTPFSTSRCGCAAGTAGECTGAPRLPRPHTYAAGHGHTADAPSVHECVVRGYTQQPPLQAAVAWRALRGATDLAAPRGTARPRARAAARVRRAAPHPAPQP